MRKFLCLAVVAVVLTFSSSIYALNTDLFRPVADNLGTFKLFGSKTLEPYKFSLGVFESYVEDTFVLKGFATAPTTRQIVDRMLTTSFVGEVGLHDRISFGFDVPLMNTRHADLATTTTYSSVWSLGDIEAHAKFRLLKLEDFPIGLSLVPFVEIPTGAVNHFTGDQNFNAGGKLTADWEYDRFYLVANLGYKNHIEQDNVTVVGTTTTLAVDDEFLYGIGARVDLIPNRLQVLADITGSTVLQDFAKTERTSPMEASGGIRAFFKDRMIGLSLGGGTGVNYGYSASKFRLFAGLSVQYPGTKYKPKSESAVKTITVEEETKTIVIKGVFFETASDKIKDESFPALDENLKLLQDNPDSKARIEGHADVRGTDEYNQKLSEARAQSVMKYFVDKGIDATRLTAIGLGEAKPLVPNTSAENMAKNRRIELHLIEKVQKIIAENPDGTPIEVKKIEKVKKQDERSCLPAGRD